MHDRTDTARPLWECLAPVWVPILFMALIGGVAWLTK
jgi:hypothetical protein